jgi:7-keto-8-aminopelargonate synthetase-like enzyme
VDGARLAGRSREGRRALFFQHNDPAHLDAMLASQAEGAGCLVIVDGVYSMEGDIAPLPEIAAVCRRHGARLMVDDAHALGVLGGGRGTAFHFGRPQDPDLVMGTFSKSLASAGGFVAGPREVIHWIQHFARPFLFTAALPPANAATVLAALDVIEAEPDRVARVVAIAAEMRRALRREGYDLGASQTPVVPIVIGDQFRTVQAWRRLFDAGVYTNAALPPAVPSRRALLRTSYMATHSDEALAEAVRVFRRLKDRILPLRSGAPAPCGELAHAV